MKAFCLIVIGFLLGVAFCYLVGLIHVCMELRWEAEENERIKSEREGK